MNTTPDQQAVLIYKAEDGHTAVEVRLEQDTLWLSLQQLANLFGRDKSAISRHLKNIFNSTELERTAVVAKNATTAADGKSYLVDYYNLDAIISVGYRANSVQGTHFRIWANRILKDYLVQGYALNQQRLAQQQENIRQLERTLTLFQQNLIDQASLPEARGFVSVISGYAPTFVLFNQFDSERLPQEGFADEISYEIQPSEANVGIAALKADFLTLREARP